MVKHSFAFTLLAAAGLLTPLVVHAQVPPTATTDDNAWDRARAALRAQGPTNWAYAIERWKTLSASNRFGFGDYAGFITSAPGFPEEENDRENHCRRAHDCGAALGGRRDSKRCVRGRPDGGGLQGQRLACVCDGEHGSIARQ